MNSIDLRRWVLPLFAACLTATAHPQNPWDTTKLGRNPAAGRYADIRGIKMYYEEYGSGEPLLFIHGNADRMSKFLYQAPFFSKKYRVILADSRAHGNTRDDGDSLSYEMMADDLAALLDHLGIDSCNVIGWSDGGINGLLLAIRHPKKVKKLAVTGANLQPDPSAVDTWVYNSVKKDWDSLQRLPLTPQLRNDKKVFHLLLFEPHIRTEDLGLIKCPTLVIAGDHDVIRPVHTLLIAQSIPHAYLWILPNSGHATPITYRDQFNKIVMDFLNTPYRTIEGGNRFK